MILRAHRVSAFSRCKRLAFNLFHRGYDRSPNWNLTDGSALHAAIAVGRATNDWGAAIDAAEQHVRGNAPVSYDGLGGDWELEQHVTIARTCAEKYAEVWSREADVKVIAPELEFEVAIPDSQHHCIFQHWADWNRGTPIEHFEPPSAGDILDRVVNYPRYATQRWTPHYVAGRADALIEYAAEGGSLWIDEYKTTSIWGDRFWSEWALDIQPTIYLYGVWKTLGILPAGVIIHAFYKPSESQVRDWNSRRKDPMTTKEVQDYVKYDRQFVTRDMDDLLRLERQLKSIGDEWEQRVASGKHLDESFPLSNVRGVCTMFGRTCDFHLACIQHDRTGFEKLRLGDTERNRLHHIEGMVAA